MFNLGAGEILVISLLALIVLGPQRLPDAAKQIGRFMGEMRKLSSGFQNELKTAFDDEAEAAARQRGAAVAGSASTVPSPAPASDAGGATANGNRPRPPRSQPLRAPAKKAAPRAKKAAPRAKRPGR